MDGSGAINRSIRTSNWEILLQIEKNKTFLFGIRRKTEDSSADEFQASTSLIA